MGGNLRDAVGQNNGFQTTDVREGVFSKTGDGFGDGQLPGQSGPREQGRCDGGDAIGKDDFFDDGIGKGVITAAQGGGNVNRQGGFNVAEGPVAQGGDALRQDDFAQAVAVGEGEVADGRDGFGNVDFRQSGSVEGVFSDFGQIFRNGHGFQRTGPVEAVGGNLRDAVGQNNGFQTTDVREGVFSKTGDGFGDGQLPGQSGPREQGRCDGGDAIGKDDFFDDGIGKGVITAAQGGGNVNRQGGFNVAEGPVAQGGDALRQDDFAQAVAVGEGEAPNGSQGFGQRDRGQVAAVPEGVGADGFHRQTVKLGGDHRLGGFAGIAGDGGGVGGNGVGKAVLRGGIRQQLHRDFRLRFFGGRRGFHRRPADLRLRGEGPGRAVQQQRKGQNQAHGPEQSMFHRGSSHSSLLGLW